MAPDDLAAAVAECARPLGVLNAVVYLVDLQQGWLRPMPSEKATDRVPLSIDGTMAGRAYRLITEQIRETDDGRPLLWLPLLDGSARLGVLELVVEYVSDAALARFRALASLVGLLVVSKSTYS